MNVCSEELSAVVLGVSEGQVVVLFEEEYCQYCFYWKFFWILAGSSVFLLIRSQLKCLELRMPRFQGL